MSDSLEAADSPPTSFFDTETPSGEIYALVGSNDIAVTIMDRIQRDGTCTVMHLGKFPYPATPDIPEASLNLWAVDGHRVAAIDADTVWEDMDISMFHNELRKYQVKL